MHGQCNCGAVSFEISGKLPNMYQCHCTLCQKQGGTGSNASTIVEVENFRWLAGEHNISKWQKASGFSSHFCTTCGSPVPNQFRDVYMWIPLGLIGDAATSLVANIYTDDSPNWATLHAATHTMGAGPASVEDLLDLLNSK